VAQSISAPADSGKPGIGHNGAPLTDEQFDDLVAYYTVKIRAQRRKADAKKAEYDAEREEVNGLFALVKGDLKYKRKEFEALLAAQDQTSAEFMTEEARRSRLFRAGGLVVGPQLDLFAPTDTAGDQVRAMAEGKRAYYAGADPVPPKHISAILHPSWMEGWTEGQDEVAAKMQRAEALIAERKKPAPPPAAAEAPKTEEGAAPPDEEEVKKQTRALKKSGWAEKPKAGSPEAQKVLDQARADEAADRAAGQFEHAGA